LGRRTGFFLEISSGWAVKPRVESGVTGDKVVLAVLRSAVKSGGGKISGAARRRRQCGASASLANIEFNAVTKPLKK
jgi:hypothetical protein